MAYQSLYRRYRPQTFGAIKGQEPVVKSLGGAVASDHVGHAYLLHGPRGTGKTTAARVLAKALNCESRAEGESEPCGTCESCLAIEQGRSFDLHELDAASNRGVDAMRSLLDRVKLGTPGRAKVYLLDEVHMLTDAANNALLKTLEEPPEHVHWILATTEPHKVLETIRSRCQVYELTLLPADLMEEHVRWVVEDAGLDVDDDAIDHVVAEGGGSVRDTLSALDRVVAAGGVIAGDTNVDTILDALAARDTAAALRAVGDATGRGRDPRVVGSAVVAGLRDGFLTAMGAPPPRLSQSEQSRAGRLAKAMSPAAMTRALETLGIALVDMRQSPDARVDLEVALVRLCRPETDSSVEALIERIERLESASPGRAGAVASPGDEAPPGQSVEPPPSAEEDMTAEQPAAPVDSFRAAPSDQVDDSSDRSAPSPAPRSGGADAARRALAASRKASPDAPSEKSSAAATPPPVPRPDEPSVDLEALEPTSPTEVIELAEHHLGLDRGVVIARAKQLLPPKTGESRDPAELQPLWQALVAEALAGSGSADAEEPPPPLLEPDVEARVVEQVPTAGRAPADADDPVPDVDVDVDIDVDDLVDAPSHAEDMLERLTEAFPGAELITVDEEEESSR